MEKRHFRLRRCDGNKAAWGVFTVRDNGQEAEAAFSYTTGLSPEGAFHNALAEGLIRPGDVIEYV